MGRCGRGSHLALRQAISRSRGESEGENCPQYKLGVVGQSARNLGVKQKLPRQWMPPSPQPPLSKNPLSKVTVSYVIEVELREQEYVDDVSYGAISNEKLAVLVEKLIRVEKL